MKKYFRAGHIFLRRAISLLPWSLPVKFGLTFLAGALGGAGLLSYLSEYATYSYAIFYGLRPPLEGIPYLKAVVGFGSSFLLLSGAILFALVITFLRSLTLVVQVIALTEELRSRKKRMSLRRRIVLFRLKSKKLAEERYKGIKWYEAAFLIGGSTLLGLGASQLIILIFKKLELETVWQVEVLTYALPPYLFLAAVLIIFPRSIWVLGTSAVVIYFSGWICILFTPDYYARLLRTLGYGGGILVTVQLRDDESIAAKEIREGHLMMRTSESVVLLSSDKKKFDEIPTEQVRMISHKVGGLYNMDYKLPR